MVSTNTQGRAVADDEMFRVQASGKRKKKVERVVTKITRGPNFI